MIKSYTPDAGDIVHIHFSMPATHRGPDFKAALVLSPATYNRKSGLMVCCAVTSEPTGYPFEVELEQKEGYAALADQLKSLAWAGIKISHQGRARPEELAAARAKLTALLLPG